MTHYITGGAKTLLIGVFSAMLVGGGCIGLRELHYEKRARRQMHYQDYLAAIGAPTQERILEALVSAYIYEVLKATSDAKAPN